MYSRDAEALAGAQMNLTGQRTEAGEGTVTEKQILGTAGESVPYDQVFSAYQARALQALTDESIPYGVRELVSEYFSSLEK